MVRNTTYHNRINQEENTPLVTILELKIETKQATAIDSRRGSYVIDLAKSSFGGIRYPSPGSQWYLKKISGVWTLMARAPQQNPQLDPAFDPQPGETYIGGEGKTYIVGDLEVTGTLTSAGSGGPDPEIGTIKLHAGSSAPTGWVLCDGSAISRTTFAALFAVIGTTFGVGDGSTTFNVPDLRGRVPVGQDSGQSEFNVLGETGGAKTHALTEAELAAHDHNVGELVTGNQSVSHTHAVSITSGTVSSDHTHNVPNVISPSGSGSGAFFESWPGGTGSRTHTTTGISANHTHAVSGDTGSQSASHSHTITGSTADAGSGTAHNNLQPYIAINFIIKAMSGSAVPASGIGTVYDGEQFNATGMSSSSNAFTAKVEGDTQKRLIVTADGDFEWSDGTTPSQFRLERHDADDLQVVNARFRVRRESSTDPAFGSYVTGDSQTRFNVRTDGRITWSDGTLSADTNLYRSAADTLKTDDAFTVAGAFKIGSGAVEIDPASPATGEILRYNGTKFVSVGEETIAQYPNAVFVQNTSVNQAITSTSYVDINGMSVSFTKNYASTKVRMFFDASYYHSAAGMNSHFAFQINGVDYECMRSVASVLSGTRHQTSGLYHLAGLGAGVYTVKLRAKVSTSQMNMDTNDIANLEAMEVK